MKIDPSSIIYFEWHFVRITATLVFTWVTMLVIVLTSSLIVRGLKSKADITKGQNILEALFITISDHIKEISQQDPKRYFPFISTLFIFIFISNILSVVPGFSPPTGSLNTTIALSLCVFLAVPAFGISSQGVAGYFRKFTRPSILMLPFNIIGEFTRIISLAVRLYGNVLSTTIIAAILLGVIPLVFPIIIQLLGLLTGVIQAYIFSILAIVYIAAAVGND